MKRKDIIADICNSADLWVNLCNEAQDPEWKAYCRGRIHSFEVALGLLEQ